MNYLIDGHNLIARMPDLSLEDPDDEAKLVRRLQMWAAAGRKRRVMVIFDRGVVAGKSAQLSNNQIQVYFAPANQTADSLLVRHINRVQNPAEHILISSDRAIITVAEARGMRTVFAEVFAAQMEEERQPPPPPTEPSLSEAEIAEWFDLFGPVPERPAAPPRVPPRQSSPPPAAPVQPPPPPRVYSPEEYKAGLAHMSAEELAEWIALFGPEPEPAPPDATPVKTAPPPRLPAARPHSLAVEDERKEGRARLTPEEIELWLEQFGGEDPRHQA